MPIITEGPAATYTFKELREEAAARGFTDMLDSGPQEKRLGRWVNEACREINDLAPWPFLRDEVEGTAPLEAPELGHVLSVSNLTASRQVVPVDERQIAERDPAAQTTGVACEWYRLGLTTIEVWPSDSTSRLRVRYAKQPAPLVNDGDEAIIPATYQDLIIDGTVVRLYKNRDNFEAAQFVRQEWERGVTGMKHALLKPNYDRERTIIRTGSVGDYLG
jgi:hypothetical protein